MSKQEVRRNPLADWVVAIVQYVRGHQSLVLSVVIAAVVIAGALGAFFWYEGRQELEARHALGKAEAALGGQKPGIPGNLDDAAKQFADVAAKYPRTVSGEEAIVRLGNLRYDGGKFDEAISAYSQHLSQFPRGKFRVLAAVGKAYAEEAKGDLQAEVKTLTAIVDSAATDPLAGEAYTTLARAYEALKKPEDALRVYGQITDKFPQTQWAQNALQRMSALKAKS